MDDVRMQNQQKKFPKNLRFIKIQIIYFIFSVFFLSRKIFIKSEKKSIPKYYA